MDCCILLTHTSCHHTNELRRSSQGRQGGGYFVAQALANMLAVMSSMALFTFGIDQSTNLLCAMKWRYTRRLLTASPASAAATG